MSRFYYETLSISMNKQETWRGGADKPGTDIPGNAGLCTRIAGSAGLCTRISSLSASAEPRVPSAEPRVPSAAPRVPSAASRVPGASAAPRVPGAEPRGWNSRGYLPHFDSNDRIQHVTFHLVDSLPKETVERLVAEIQQVDPDRRDIEMRSGLEALVDAGHGVCWLRRADCARIVQDALLHFDGERYRMIAWVVMPNHVHALFQTLDGWSMNTVVGSWKTFTANAIGRIVRQSGEPAPSIWHPEFWDRFIRNDHHFASALAYIHNNPVKAGLVAHPEDWSWSSANPGAAGLRTRISSLPASAAPRAPGASAEPRVPGASAEPRVPRGAPAARASAEPRVPGAAVEPRFSSSTMASAEPRVPRK